MPYGPEEFKRVAIEERQALCAQTDKLIWSTEILDHL